MAKVVCSERAYDEFLSEVRGGRVGDRVEGRTALGGKV